MAITERYFDPDLVTGSNDGTSEANAWQTWAAMEAGRVAGERVNAKNPASRYTPGANIALAVNATNLLVSIFRGYGSTIGDGTKFQFDMEAGRTLTITGEGTLFQTCDVTGGDITDLVAVTGDHGKVEDGIFVNTGTSANLHRALRLVDASATNCYIETNSTSATGLACSMSRGALSNSIVVSTAKGVSMGLATRVGIVSDVLIYEKGSSAITGLEVTGHVSVGFGFIKNVTVDGYVDGIDLTSVDEIVGTEPIIIEDSIISNCTTGIANTDTATKNMTVNVSTIAFYNCTTDTELGDNEVQHKISLTADPYTNAAGDDYTLNDTAGGGADCRAVSIFGGGQLTNYRDIGALQHQDSGGGGGGIVKLAGDGGGLAA